jgi:hypothetical protein
MHNLKRNTYVTNVTDKIKKNRGHNIQAGMFKHMEYALYKQDMNICAHQNESISVFIITQLLEL